MAAVGNLRLLLLFGWLALAAALSDDGSNANLFPNWVKVPTFVPLFMMRKKESRRNPGIASLGYEINTNPLTVSLNMGQAIHGLGGVKGLRGGSLKRMYWGNQMHSFFEHNNDLAGWSFPRKDAEKLKTPADVAKSADLERSHAKAQEDPDVERVRAFHNKMALKYYHGNKKEAQKLKQRMQREGDHNRKVFEASQNPNTFRGHHLNGDAPSLEDLERAQIANKKRQHLHMSHGPGRSSAEGLNEFWARKGGNGVPATYGHPEKDLTAKTRMKALFGMTGGMM